MKNKAMEGGSHQAKLKIVIMFEFGPAITNLLILSLDGGKAVNLTYLLMA